MNDFSEKIREEVSSVRKEIRNRTVSYIVAAFSLVAGLAWNDAIKSFIEYFFPLNHNGLKAKFIYATVITLVVVLITVYLMRIMKKEEEKIDAETNVQKEELSK